ncbi:MAG TPA: M14 family metallopeptidase, partial [Pyrinomonadaceae bacterium]|nr:M14 family metallopeptidase [Pyrinomonadaceae bacterium]
KTIGMRFHSFSFTPLAFITVFLCGLLAPGASAQRKRPAAPSSLTTNQIPAPRAVLGFTPGDDRRLADWKQISNYFKLLDAASSRVTVETVGETTLGRPLLVALVSAPENIRDLGKYKEIQRRLADPRTVRNDAERDRLIREGRTIVAVSCSIHSTEVVGSQMAMQLTYELATAQDAETVEMLRNTILLLIPSANPDGNAIVADWYRRTLGTPDEGVEPPELYHHYAGHDNNRDWFMLNLKETQALTRLFWKEWFPQIVYDVHQQGATGSRFFIPPFYDPPNPAIAPLLLREVALIGHKIAADMQSAGVQGVVTNAMYDTWWHGGFRTAPYYHNSVGILSEAASAKLMTPMNVTGAELEKTKSRGMPAGALQPATNFPDPWPGGLWRPRDIMNMELIAVRSVLSMAAKYRERYLRNFYQLGRDAVSEHAAPDSPLAYLIPAGQGKDENVAKMIGALVAQGVEVHRMNQELYLTHAPQQDVRKAHETPGGSYLVFLAQPYRANVRALFERQVYPERRTDGGEAERPYDVAGWTLPLQMGVEALPVFGVREPESARRLAPITDEREVRRDLGLRPKSGDKSPIATPLTRPVRVGLYKSWTNSMDEGWTRFVFDTFNVPYTNLRDRDARGGNLRVRFDVIVLPDMTLKDIVEGREAGKYPAEYVGGIGEAGVKSLREFIEAGGTLLCFDSSSELAIKRFGLPVRNALEGIKTSEFYCPGSILALDVDTAHPMARGMSRDVNAYFINSSAFEIVGDSSRVRVVARYAEKDMLRSGWLLGEKYLTGKAALVEVKLGKGRVVLFGFRPQHRAQTWGTFPFIFNAINGGDSGQSE